MDPANSSLLGKVLLGRYRILRHLADGGMGAIYLARSEGAAGFVRPVVVKCVLPNRLGDDQMVKLFVREARIMASLRHPGIVSIIDFAEEGGMHIMVMEYVHGFHLGRWHKFIKRTQQRFPVELAIYIALHVLRALNYGYSLKGPNGQPLNIVHRDVTPSNVLISVEGHVKLADFGIARTSQEHTEVGASTIKGKFPYLAPEILAGFEPTHRSDVYSVGLFLHELLVGKNEFRCKEMAATVARVLKHEPTPVDAVREVPPGLGPVIAKALAKDPELRYQTAGELAEALSNVRHVTEDEGAKRLAARAAQDFNDPKMAGLLKLPQLNALEADWTTPSGAGIVPDLDLGGMEDYDVVVDEGEDATALESPGAKVLDDRTNRDPGVPSDLASSTATELLTPASSSGVTAAVAAAMAVEAAAAKAKTAAPSAKQRSIGLMVLVGVAIAAFGAIAVIALIKSGQSSQPAGDSPIIVVSERTKPSTDPGTPQPDVRPILAVDAGAATKPGGTDPVTKPGGTKPVTKPGGRKLLTTTQRLNRAFAKRKGKLAGCFQRHRPEASGPQISVRLTVSAAGVVTAAGLIPASEGSTGLGKCLLRVVRATKFGKQDKTVTFRVPIKTRIR